MCVHACVFDGNIFIHRHNTLIKSISSDSLEIQFQTDDYGSGLVTVNMLINILCDGAFSDLIVV